MKFSKAYAIAAVLAAVIIWGLSIVCIKVSVDSFPPMTMNLLRFGSAALFLFILLRLKEKNTRMKRQDILLLLITGGLGITGYYYITSFAVNYISASSAGIITGTIPIFTVIGEFIFFNKKIRLINNISIFMSIAGLYLIIGGGASELISPKYILGNCLMILAVLCWVAYTLLTGKLHDRYSGMAAVTYQTIFGAALFLPFSFYEIMNAGNMSKVLSIIDRPYDLKVVIINILFVGLLSSAIGYCLYIYGMRIIGVSASSLFLNVSPVVTLITGYFFLKDSFTADQFIGTILILLSVVVINLEAYSLKKEAAAG